MPSLWKPYLNLLNQSSKLLFVQMAQKILQILVLSGERNL